MELLKHHRNERDRGSGHNQPQRAGGPEENGSVWSANSYSNQKKRSHWKGGRGRITYREGRVRDKEGVTARCHILGGVGISKGYEKKRRLAPNQA